MIASDRRRRPVLSAAPRISALDLATLSLPALSFLEITIIGRLIVTEIVLLASLPWLWNVSGRPAIPRWYVILWAGWLLSQVFTDIVVGSTFTDLARGWAGIAFTLTNFAAIFVLVTTPRRARLFAIGLAIGGLLGFVFVPHPAAASDPWKWGIALSVGLLIAAAASAPMSGRWRGVSIAALASYGILNLVLGYRSLAGISLVAAAYLIFNVLLARRRTAREPSRRRAVVGLAFLAAAAFTVLGFYSLTASSGLLGPEAQQTYRAQGGALGILLGGRPEALVSTEAILDSPVLGHGSWAKDPTYARLLAERQEELGYSVNPIYVGTDLIPAHSYLLGAWVWAGFLGGLFWFAVAAVVIWMLANLYAARLELIPLLAFSALLLLWDIAFSPYSLTARVMAPYQLALCLVGLRLLHEDRAARTVGDPHPDQSISPALGWHRLEQPDRQAGKAGAHEPR